MREKTLLAAIAASPADDVPRRILADYWLEHGDGDRGLLIQASCEGLAAHVHALFAEHGMRWFEPLWGAGFSPERLAFERGFPRPLAVRAGDHLLTRPDLFRISPIVYRLDECTAGGPLSATWTATKLSIAGSHGVVRVRTHGRETSNIDLVERERAILERFAHPVIPALLDIAQDGAGAALVLPPVGLPLSPGPIEVAGVARLGAQIAEGLAVLHAGGVYHGWIERRAITITANGALLDDFDESRSELDHSDREFHVRDRRNYHYLSPEQVRGLPTTNAVDVFSLAMVLAEIAQGFHPVRAAHDNAFEALVAIRDLAFELPITATPLGKVLARALLRKPELRPTAAELAEQLAAFR